MKKTRRSRIQIGPVVGRFFPSQRVMVTSWSCRQVIGKVVARKGMFNARAVLHANGLVETDRWFEWTSDEKDM